MEFCAAPVTILQVHSCWLAAFSTSPLSILFLEPFSDFACLNLARILHQIFTPFQAIFIHEAEFPAIWILIAFVTETQCFVLQACDSPTAPSSYQREVILSQPSVATGQDCLTTVTSDLLWLARRPHSFSNGSLKLLRVLVCPVDEACSAVETTSANKILVKS